MQHCGPCPTTNNTNSNTDNGAAAAAAAAEAEAAADAKRQRDAELEQQRIDAENQRLAEEAEKRAKFDRDKRDALDQLKGIANGDDFDSGSGLKGVGSADSGLKNAPYSGDSSGLKTLPDVNTDPMVVDARNVPTGLPKSVEAEIPDTPAGNSVRKGFEAILDHNWKVALVWFQDALNHDPGNAGIQRLIDLAQFTMEREKRPRPSAQPAKAAVEPSAQDKPAMATKDKQGGDQMNTDLANSLDAFNRDYTLKHPELLRPPKPSSPGQTTKPATVVPTPEQPELDENAKWNLFFHKLFPIIRYPMAIAAVRG